MPSARVSTHQAYQALAGCTDDSQYGAEEGKARGSLPWPSAVMVALRERLARDASAQLREHRSQ